MSFLSNTKNKVQFIKFFFNWLIVNRRKTLSMLRTTNLYLSTERSFERLLFSDISLVDNLISTQEETGFRLIVHAKHSSHYC